MDSNLLKAIEILNNDGIVGMPTETVYGLAGKINSKEAINKIFATKERPFFDPLIVHVASIEQAKSLTSQWNLASEALSQEFWPGPLTLILKKNDSVSDLITSGLDTVGIRMPNHPLALDLIKTIGVPLAAPSANKFGKTSPTKKSHVDSEFESEEIFCLEGGSCEVGLESTIVKIELFESNEYSIQLLRSGRISIDEILRVLEKNKIKFNLTQAISKIEAPGQMKHHYMPNKPFILVNDLANPTAIYQKISNSLLSLPDQIEGVKIIKPKTIKSHIELTLSKEPFMAFREFYSALREASNSTADIIVFVRPDYFDLPVWTPLNERINKAASLKVD